MDESIFPSVFTKLEKLGKDQRYKIEVSTSEGSTEELPEEPPKELPEEVKTEEESIEEPEDLETPVIEEEPEELPEQYPVEEPPEELPEQYSVEEQPEEEPELEEIVIVKDEELQKPRQLPEQKDETNIEPSLANVSDSIEKLTAEFADWLIAHGIPLWKISQIGIQTSLDVLPPYRAEPVPIQCYCDKPVTVDVDDSKETALQILKRILTKVLNQHSNYMTQKLITSVGALKNVRKKACLKMTNYKCIFEVKPVRDTKISEVSDGKITSTLSESEDRETTFETRESDVRQEMLNIINGIIDKLQTKIQEQITTESDVVAESFDEILEHGISESFSQKQFSNIFDKPEIITYEDRCQNTTRSVTFDEPTFSKKENQKQTGRSKLLKQISKYIRRSKNKAPKESVDSEAIDNNFRTVKDKTPQKKMKVRPSEKCNLQESCTAIGNRIHAPKKRRSIPMGKMGQKLYSTCEKAEAKLSEKLGISQEFCVRSGPSSSGETSDKRKKQKCGQKLKEETEPSENLGTSQEFCLCSVPSSSGETSDGRKKQKCEQKLKILIKSGTRDDEISKGASSKQKCFCDVTYISERSDYDSASTQRGSGGVSDAEDMRFQQMSYLDAVRDNRRFEDTHMRHLSTNTSIFYSSKRNQYTRRDSLEERREMSETYRRTCFCDFEESERQQTIFHRRYENKYQRNETKNRKNDNFEKYDNGQNFVPYKNEKFDQLEIEDNSYRESLIFAISSLERLIAKLHLKLDSCSNIGNRNIHHRTKSTLSNIYENVEICDANDIPTDDYASDTFSTIIETENSVVGEKQNFLTSESSPTLIPKTDNKIFLDKDSTKSDNSLLYKFSKLTKNLNSSESSCRNLRKEAHIKKSLDDFLTDIISSWVSSQSSLSEKSILDIRSRTSTLYDDYIMQHNNLSQTSTKCKKDESFSTITSELSFLGATNTSNEDISAFNLIERASQNSVDRYLKPEDVDDVREIIRLLSKLCPRVLCNYYVKKMQS